MSQPRTPRTQRLVVFATPSRVSAAIANSPQDLVGLIDARRRPIRAWSREVVPPRDGSGLMLLLSGADCRTAQRIYGMPEPPLTPAQTLTPGQTLDLVKSAAYGASVARGDGIMLVLSNAEYGQQKAWSQAAYERFDHVIVENRADLTRNLDTTKDGEVRRTNPYVRYVYIEEDAVWHSSGSPQDRAWGGRAKRCGDVKGLREVGDRFKTLLGLDLDYPKAQWAAAHEGIELGSDKELVITPTRVRQVLKDAANETWAKAFAPALNGTALQPTRVFIDVSVADARWLTFREVVDELLSRTGVTPAPTPPGASRQETSVAVSTVALAVPSTIESIEGMMGRFPTVMNRDDLHRPPELPQRSRFKEFDPVVSADLASVYTSDEIAQGLDEP